MEKNGSGKSTILELLLRFYEPEEGEILCNGENIKVLKLSEYRSLFSVVEKNLDYSAIFIQKKKLQQQSESFIVNNI